MIISRDKLLYFVLFSCLFFLSGCVFALITHPTVQLIVLFMVGFICLLLDKKVRCRVDLTAEWVFIICMMWATFMSCISNLGAAWLDHFMLGAMVLIAYLVTKRISFGAFASTFSKAMTVLTAIAIVVKVLVDVGVPVPCLTFSNGSTTYNTVFVCSWIENPWSITKNKISGIFWEPGLFASMAIYAILCESCYSREKPKLIRMLILSIGILLSQSTAGYLIMLLVYYYVFFREKKWNQLINILTMILILAGFVFFEQITQWLYKLYPNIFWKLSMQDEANITLNTRVMSPALFFRVFLQNPLFGVGYNGAIQSYKNMSVLNNIDAFTSTSGFMIAAFGILGASYTIFLCRGAFRQKKICVSMKLILCAVLLLIVNKEPHNANMFTYIIMFYLNEEVHGGREVEHYSETIHNAKIK